MGRYKILSLLGMGGMASVYKAADLEKDMRTVALKVVHPWVSEDPTSFQRFLVEQEITQDLRHPNLVQVYQVGQINKITPYMVMEFVEGQSLADRLEGYFENRISLKEAIMILYQICMGLDFAHACRVIHRDLKPENIMLDKQGVVKITDFGIAKADYIHKKLTQTGEMVGTPCYMAPEFLKNPKVDHRADIYALGINAFELATGDPPFDHSNPLSITAMHVKNPLPDISEKGSDFPKWYQDFVEICAAKKPSHRFQNIADAGRYLEKYFVKNKVELEPNDWKFQPKKSLLSNIFGLK